MLQSRTMSLSWLITNFVSVFLLPPFNLLLLAAVGLALLKRHPRLGRRLVVLALALLYVISMPITADTALRSIEPDPTDPLTQPADAIVVLGGGTYFDAPEYGGDTVSDAALERLRYAARLHRKTGKPILVTGGQPLGNAISEAAQMQAVLEQDFQVPVAWLEEISNNTLENATHSYSMLHAANIARIYLVTHAWHMARAKKVFETAGFTVVPASTRYVSRRPLSILDFLPQADALHNSKTFMKEIIGMAWYQLKS